MRATIIPRVRLKSALLSVRSIIIFLFSIFLFSVGCHYSSGLKSVPLSPKPTEDKQANLILITIDTLRADHLGCYGYQNGETPHIDELAKEGVLFSRAYTPVPVTLPSHISIFTGLYPIYHGVRNNGTFKADDKLETLTEVLKQKGFRTGAFIGSFVLDSRYGLAQGFDDYDDYLEQDANQNIMIYNERTADRVVQSAIKWLEKNGKQRFFMWLHCFDPHAPYNPPAPFNARYKTNLYTGEIAYVDQVLGKLFSTLKEKEIMDQTMVVITADHGEGLGEHAEKTHAIFIYDSTLHVPLIMRYPKLIAGGTVVESNVSTIDIMPTVLDMLDIQKSSLIQGESLLGLIKGKRGLNRQEFLCETFYTLYNHTWSPLEGLRTDKWKFIKAPRPELYDLENDPREMINLFNQNRETARRLEDRMAALHEQNVSRPNDFSAQLHMDKDTQERLKSLGYIWAAPVTSGKKPTFLPDPKDMIATLDYLNMGTYFYTKGDYQRAVEQFKLMLKVNPNDMFTHYLLGYVYDKQELTDLAIQELQEALRLDPTYVNAYNNLGTIYNRLGRPDEALEMFKMALKFNPDYVEIHDNMGAIYFSLKEYDKAAQGFQKAIELNPHECTSYNNLGSVYLAVGKYAEAEKMMLKALALNPSFIDGLNNLGTLYLTQREYSKAILRFQELVKYDPDYVEGWANLAATYVGLEKYEEAKGALEKAMALNPDMASVYTCLGTIYVKQAQWEAAISQFQKSISLDPDTSDTHYNLGIAYYNSGRIDQAIEEYHRSLALDDLNPSIHVNLGIAYFSKGEVDQSQAEYQKAILKDPHNAEAHINLGVVYYNKGEYDKALAEYKRAVEINPQNIQPYVNTGLTLLAKGKVAEAILEYKKALEINPENLEAHVNLASVYFNQGEYNLALARYLKIVEIDHQNPVGYYGLGYTYFYQGMFDQAISALQNALVLKPDYLEARLLLDRAITIKGN